MAALECTMYYEHELIRSGELDKERDSMTILLWLGKMLNTSRYLVGNRELKMYRNLLILSNPIYGQP